MEKRQPTYLSPWREKFEENQTFVFRLILGASKF